MTRHRAWSLVFLAVLIGTILRFLGIESKSIHLDEIASLAISTGHHWYVPLEDDTIPQASFYRTFISLDPGYFSQHLISVLRSESQMPFYYFLLNLWLNLFGTSEAAVRSLSVLVSISAIPVLYALGRRLVSTEAGVITAMIFAVAPFQVAYAQFARPYTLLLSLAILSTLCALRLSRGEQKRRWLFGYAVVAVLGLYTHYLFFWNMIFHWILVIFCQRRNPSFLLRWGVTQLLVIGALLPWAPVFLDQLYWNTRLNTLNWSYWKSGTLSPFDVILYTGRDLALFLSAGRLQGLCPYAAESNPCRLDAVLTGLSYGVPILIMAACAWRLFFHVRSVSLENRASTEARIICLLWVLCIFAGSVVIDIVANSHTIKTPRYLISATAPLYLFVAIGFTSLPRRLQRRWTVSAFVLFLTAGSVFYLQGFARTIKYEQGFREVAKYLDQAARADDLILLSQPGLNALNLAYYLRSDSDIGAILDGKVPWKNEHELALRIKKLISGRNRFWFLDDHGRETTQIMNILHQHNKDVEVRKFRNLDLFLFAASRG